MNPYYLSHILGVHEVVQTKKGSCVYKTLQNHMSLFFFHIYFTRCDLGPPKQKSKLNPLNTGAGIDRG